MSYWRGICRRSRMHLQVVFVPTSHDLIHFQPFPPFFLIKMLSKESFHLWKLTFVLEKHHSLSFPTHTLSQNKKLNIYSFLFPKKSRFPMVNIISRKVRWVISQSLWGSLKFLQVKIIVKMLGWELELKLPHSTFKSWESYKTS